MGTLSVVVYFLDITGYRQVREAKGVFDA